MKRMVIFGELGPPIAFVVSFWALIPLFNWSVGGSSVFDLHQLVLLPMFYIMGLGPALLAGLFDDYLAGAERSYVCSGAGWAGWSSASYQYWVLQFSSELGLCCCSVWLGQSRQ
jgi:hypothetical protein